MHGPPQHLALKREERSSQDGSQVVTIEFDGEIETAFKSMTDIMSLIESSYNQAYGDDVKINLHRLALNADPITVPQFRNTTFFIERRIQRPYSENRYQSGAPLRTEDHIALLEAIERLLLNARAI